MLVEFYDRAKQIIEKHCPEINQRTESGTQLYVNGENVSLPKVAALTAAFEAEGYSFAIEAEEDGYIQVLQKSIPYSQGDCGSYGHIPEDCKPIGS